MAAEDLGGPEDFFAAHVAVQHSIAQPVVSGFQSEADGHTTGILEQGHFVVGDQIGSNLAPEGQADLGLEAVHEFLEPLVLQNEGVVHEQDEPHVVTGDDVLELGNHIAHAAAAEAATLSAV